ncbi:conserved protein of unknown function [Georgfuchsia toluolica]|uniref:Uncharacterized protein n=1 Tax=Georgfuchsia toluolica TaxID=424218 RepID=A0A916J4J7_9PROT|nr:hypothetical protein [Georgfuchsia toluolica]CAG4883273.1 conserved protein of unknown function [Georgfuchsia toluolica]
MAVLFNQHWDIAPGKQEAYSDFLMSYYNPTLEKIGIKLVGGYYVTVGMGPRIIAVGLAQNLNELEEALASADYEEVTNRLMEFVTHYHSKILIPTGRVKMDGYKIQTGLWKFNQYWNLLPGMEQQYTEFVTGDYIPTLEKLGLIVTAGWRVVVGSGPYILAESSAANLVDIARAIDTDEFRRVIRKLKSMYVTDYHSRILAPTGRIDLPYFMKEMMAHF